MTAVSASMKMISIASAGMDLFKMHHAYPQRYPFLLESVAHGHLGHYDIYLHSLKKHSVVSMSMRRNSF